tara:strand:+ start:119 stop:316 length:198 start_codon:yes stop_codon:yes gene_type:complete
MISKRQKVTLSRDDYRDFTQKVAQLEEANYEFIHVVTHNKEEDTFTIEVHGEHDYDKLDDICDAS